MSQKTLLFFLVFNAATVNALHMRSVIFSASCILLASFNKNDQGVHAIKKTADYKIDSQAIFSYTRVPFSRKQSKFLPEFLISGNSSGFLYLYFLGIVKISDGVCFLKKTNLEKDTMYNTRTLMNSFSQCLYQELT